jgi:hypothetical protein
MGHSRAIPFVPRPAIREQIRQMIEDDVLEISHSLYVYINPIRIAYREGESPRRPVNSATIPDRERDPSTARIISKISRSPPHDLHRTLPGFSTDKIEENIKTLYCLAARVNAVSI